MLLRNIIRYSGRSWVYHGKVTANQQDQIRKFSKSCYVIKEEKLLSTRTTSIKTNHDIKRFYADGVDESSAPKTILPPLTDDVLRTMPNIFIAMRSAWYLHAVIGARLDSEFSMPDFIEGSTQAVMMVSDALAREDYDSLYELVDNNAIDKLRNKISTLSQEQKELIRVYKNDIFGTFPYEIRVINEGEGDNTRTIAEIEMVYQTLRGRRELEAQDQASVMGMLAMSEFEYRIILCNYTFRRDYTNGNSEPWVISKCNHFMLIAR